MFGGRERSHLRQTVQPPLPPVLHEIREPLFSVIGLLLAEGLYRGDKQAEHYNYYTVLLLHA